MKELLEIIIKKILIASAVIVAVGCSQTEFNQKDSTQNSYDVMVGQVDILFVNDNSGSMSEEHRKMADAFPNFIQGLDLAGLDYRIGIITTDVQSKNNPLINNGALQNGNLLEFPNGDFYLTPSSKSIEQQFADTIQREETLNCERSGFKSDFCPSDDERGIYAAYLAVNGNKKKFFRKNGHLALIFLTDEDVRGTGLNNHPFRLPEALDYPANLINIINEKLGKNTDISAHSIITDSETCKQKQRGQSGNQYIHGAIGSFYKALTNPNTVPLIGTGYGATLGDLAGGQLVKGVVGSICSDDYVGELGSIKSILSKTKSVEHLRCRIFNEDDLKIRIDADYEWELSETKDSVIFTPALPPGKSFKIEYECF